MGNGPSRRRRSDSSMYPSYTFSPGPVSYTPYVPPNSYIQPAPYQHPRFPAPYHSDYNGHIAPPGPPHFCPPRGYHVPPVPNPQFVSQASTSATLPVGGTVQQQPAAQQQTITVRNAVNIKKGTIRLIRDEENPDDFLLSFSYDADSPGSFSIFLFAKEDDKDSSIKPLNPKIFNPRRVSFEKGVAKTFQQAPGTGIYLGAYDAADLENEMADHTCPLVIRAQTNALDAEQSVPNTVEDIGAAPPRSVNSQITQAVIQKKDDSEFKVRVLRQIIWVDGVRYELKELYGVENAVDKSEYNEDDLGKECVICMSEPRDTAVMPCRHLCMCSDCASSFREQMNKCPICRQHVGSLLKINFKS